jgi:hypothetical protein
MSLLDVLRSGVKIADSVTKSLQCFVTFEKYVLDADGYGTEGYLPSVQLRAIVDWRQKQVRQMDGVLTVSRASILFLDVAAVATATGGEGIGNFDKITLPDGDTGPILDMAGFVDAGTAQPVATEVFIG